MFKKIFLLLYLIPILLTPTVVLAQAPDGVVHFPCDTYDTCTFSKIFGIYDDKTGESLFGNVYRFLVLYLAVPLATFSIVVGGIMYATSSVKPAQRDLGKKIITYAVIGLIIVLTSFLIVETIIKGLARDPDSLISLWVKRYG